MNELVGNVRQLDQKNRTHIPDDLLKLAGIEYNSFVSITYDANAACIQIRKLPDELAEKLT